LTVVHVALNLIVVAICSVVSFANSKLRKNEILAKSKLLDEIERRDGLVATAVRTSHDIRSPIMAINTALPYLSGSQEATDLVRHGSQRINEIANDLLGELQARAKDSKVYTTDDLVTRLRTIISIFQSTEPGFTFLCYFPTICLNPNYCPSMCYRLKGS